MRLQTTNLTKILGLHLLGGIPAFFLTSYFSYFYSQTYSFVLFCLIFQIGCGIFAVLFLGEKLGNAGKALREHWIPLLVFFTILGLVVSTAAISWQFPELFDRRVIFMESNRLPLFAILLILSAIGLIALYEWLERRPDVYASLKSAALFRYIQDNITGILLSSAFLLTYLILAQTLNFPGYRTVDLYFDSDISEWIERLTSGFQADIPPVRAVHPAVMLILRPCVWLLSLLLNGDRLQAVFLLSAMAGAGCVLLIWMIVKRISNGVYAALIASILGVSASHLLLSSTQETYIFSALALIAFVLLLQTDRTSLKSTIPMGIVIFGITVTNLAQACILYFFKQPRLKTMTLFIVAVVTSVLVLNAVQVRLFRNAAPIYQPSNLMKEQKYKYGLFENSWRFTGRVKLISRAILLYGIVAPKPFILSEELGTVVPNFRTFEITIGEFHVAGYRGFGDITVKFWMLLLGMAFILSTYNFFKSPKQSSLPLSLLLCMGFSFVLHIIYGDDPLLYSPNWVYALVLFLAFAFAKWADNRWLQIALLVFLGMTLFTNLSLVFQIMSVSLPYYGN